MICAIMMKMREVQEMIKIIIVAVANRTTTKKNVEASETMSILFS